MKTARVNALGDREGYEAIVLTIEEVGRFITNDPNSIGLGHYEPSLTELAAHALYPAPAFQRLLSALREARNDSVHIGAAARRTAEQAVEVAAILEDALAQAAGLRLVDHFMVSRPHVAEPWETLDMVRQTLMREQFSTLPYCAPDGWKLITDQAVVRFLAPDLKSRRHKSVEVAAKEGLYLESAASVPLGTDVTDLRGPNGRLPSLVMEGAVLRGIITAFDLL